MENIHGMEFWKKTSGIHFCLFHGLNFFWWIVFLFFHKENPTKIDPSTIRSNHVSSNPSFFWEGIENDDIGWLTHLTHLFYEKKVIKTHISPTCGVILVGVIRGVMPGVDEAAGDMGRGEGQGLLREGQRVDMLLRARCSSSPWWGVGRVGKKKPSVGKDF